MIDAYLVQQIIIAGLAVLFLILLCRKIAAAISWLRSKRLVRNGLRDFTSPEISRLIRWYVWPECQSIDPAQEGSLHSLPVRNDLKTILNRVFREKSPRKNLLLLADTGMGKTSFVVNYCISHGMRLRKSFRLKVVSMHSSGLDERLKAIPVPEETVLLLDGLEQDMRKRENRAAMIKELLDKTKKFRHVLITCATSFAPDESNMERLYLSPMTAGQIGLYIKRRFSFWCVRQRIKAHALLERVRRITFRPMLLSHVDDLMDSEKPLANDYQIHNEIVNAWLRREGKRTGNKDGVRKFAGRLATRIFASQEKGYTDRIHSREMEPVAKELGIDSQRWRFTHRSLIIRDTEGNFLLIHPSILEFLFAQRIINNDEEALQVPLRYWTRQVKSFLAEGINRKPWKFPLYFVPFREAAFRMGEEGRHMNVKPFELSIYPVTNQEYEIFDPSHKQKRNEYSNKDDQPVVNISWEDADRYCRWLSEKTGERYRLPIEAEWEFAAGGAEKRAYPWGNESPATDRANYIDTKIMKATPVSSYPQGKTPEGIFNMAGNVWEWCDEWYNEKQGFRVIRGGSFFDLQHYLRCDFRLGYDFHDSANYIGFRVVRDVES